MRTRNTYKAYSPRSLRCFWGVYRPNDEAVFKVCNHVIAMYSESKLPEVGSQDSSDFVSFLHFLSVNALNRVQKSLFN